MNTLKIKRNLEEEYKIFFKQNSLVVSLPFLYNWSSDNWMSYKGVLIKQKLPIRAYIWINKIINKWVKINEVKT